MEQLQVREVIRPPKGDNITLAQAKRAWRAVMRRDEQRKKADEAARERQPEARGTEA